MTYSVVVKEAFVDDDGDEVQELYNYTAYSRLPEDWRARALPIEAFRAGVNLWLRIRPMLTDISQSQPPTGIQVCLYYAFLGRRWAAIRVLSRECVYTYVHTNAERK